MRVSEREAEVLAALGQHLSNAQIASRLQPVRPHRRDARVVTAAQARSDRPPGPGRTRPSVAAVDANAPWRARGVDPVHRPPPRARRHHEAIAATRLVTLLGLGGVGKTRLAPR